VLSHDFGEDTAITITNDALPGQMRSFPSFSAALEEIVNARVFGGIHFRTACIAGQALGNSVGEYVIRHSLRRTDGCEWWLSERTQTLSPLDFYAALQQCGRYFYLAKEARSAYLRATECA